MASHLIPLKSNICICHICIYMVDKKEEKKFNIIYAFILFTIIMSHISKHNIWACLALPDCDWVKIIPDQCLTFG